MALLPLTVQPGVYANGTKLQAAGRWNEASLVRWTNGTMGPVGGWQDRGTITDQPVRAAFAWSDLSADRRLAAGTFEGLFSMLESGAVTDITPAGLVVGLVDAAINTGYGGGFYGLGLYGTERLDGASYSEATTWALDNFGELLIACSSADGVIYEWDLNVANNGVAVTNAPIGCASVMVTEERFIFAFGASGNSRLVKWCDREARTVWTAAATNEAGELELQTAGKIMCGVRTRGQSLILTDQDAHTATYQGPPFVYGFERVGTNCGVVSRKGCAVTEAGAFWMGYGSFFLYAGAGAQELPCDVSDYVFGDINAAQQSKVYAVSNAKHGEVWWFYPSSGSLENDRYVAYSYRENHWSIGEIVRTAGVDSGVFSTPIWLDAEGIAYDHEVGLSHDGAAVFAESGPIQIGSGDQTMMITDLIPDEVTAGDVEVTFKSRFYPNDAESTFGPFAMANPTSVRFSGRQFTMKVQATRNAAWRAGVMRVEAKPGSLR
jgi:hypothetical protein